MENKGQYCYRYPHPSVTADCVIFTFHDEQLKVLLVRRGIEPYKGMWALPGGFMQIDESAEECARRELREETGFDAAYVRQFHAFSRPDRDPRERVVTIAFYALVRWQSVVGGDDAAEAEWTPVSSLPPLAFDHDEILKCAVESLRRQIHFDPVGFELLDDRFSMRELQAVYQAILGREFDRRNFAKKMQHTGVVAPVEEADSADADADSSADSMPGPSVCCEPEAALPCACAPRFEDDLDEKCSAISSREAERKPRRKSLKQFLFNRARYDKLKDDNNVEF